MQDILVEKCLDALALSLTETWLRQDENDIANDLTPAGFQHLSRGSRGGAIGLLYHDSLDVVFKPVPNKPKTFELMDVLCLITIL